jgi:hypothetical protein
MCPFIAVRDCGGAVAGPGLATWIEVDVTCRLQDGRCAWDHSARKSLRRDRPQASRSRHCRAGRPVLSPLIPGCSVAGDQGPSRSPVRGPMPRRCPECKLAAPRERPSAPCPRKDGFWRQMAARPPRAIRRTGSAPSGGPASRGEWRSPSSDTLVWACSSADVSKSSVPFHRLHEITGAYW